MYEKLTVRKIIILTITIAILLTNINCATKGLIQENYPEDFYRVPKLLPDEVKQKNPTFLIYGDSRPGWRVLEKFLRKESWTTWKMLIFPFYEVYLVGHGLLGTFNWLRHKPDYGKKERLLVRDAIYEEASRSQIDFIINGGDMPTDGRYFSDWVTFLEENKIKRPLVSDFAFIPVIGNHEHANDKVYGLPNYEAIFKYPQFYLLDFLDASIFILDTDLIIDQYQDIEDDEQDKLFEQWFVGKAEPSWLEKKLMNNDKTFKIIIMHHPPISFGKHHLDWMKSSFGRNLIQKRAALLKLFQKYNVRLVFCSHEHYYEHDVVRLGSENDQDQHEIHFIVTGGGGVPLRELKDEKTIQTYLQNYKREGLDVRCLKQEKIYHYCHVEVKSDEVLIAVQEVTGKEKLPTRLVEEIRITK